MGYYSPILMFAFLSLVLLVSWCPHVHVLAVEEYNGSAIGTTNYHLELTVIAQGKVDYLRAASESRMRKPLLCVVFMRATLHNMISVIANAKRMGNTCEWALIFYAGEPAEEAKICNHPALKDNLALCTRPKITLRVATDGTDVTNTKEQSAKSVPKTVLYRRLLPVLSHYERVFLLDEDVSLVDFNYTAYAEVWDCAFPHQPPPLITQAVVAEDTQFFDFVYEGTWKNKPVIATGSGLIEQQAPIFDSIFFEWFVRRVLVHTYQFSLEYGVDWGHDRSWCNAAAMYSVEVLGWKQVSASCAIITVTSIHHLNTHAMVGKKLNKAFFKAQGVKVVQKYIDRYPTWVLMDITSMPNPLDPIYGKNYKKIEKLDRTCVARRNKKLSVGKQLS